MNRGAAPDNPGREQGSLHPLIAPFNGAKKGKSWPGIRCCCSCPVHSHNGYKTTKGETL